MGAYIDPEDMSKEDWLGENAAEFKAAIPWKDIVMGYMPIVLIQNPAFQLQLLHSVLRNTQSSLTLMI